MSDSDWEPYFFSLAWIAFREESLLAKMRICRDIWGWKRVLIDASKYASGETESGPCRSDLRPYIHRVGGPGDAAYRLVRELRLGKIRSRFRVGPHAEDRSTSYWFNREIRFGSTDIQILSTHPPLPPAAPSLLNPFPAHKMRDPRTPESEWTWVECHIGDVRERFDPAFSLLFFSGVWKAVPHADRESIDAAPQLPDAMEGIEARAIELLSRHLALLTEEGRIAFRREDADNYLKTSFALSARAFDRVWAAARRKVGLPSRAPPGRKRIIKSPHGGS